MKKHGFTLLELMIVIAIASILAVLATNARHNYERLRLAKPQAEKAATKPIERFVFENSDYWGPPAFHLITDTKTGRQYLAISQAGIIELNPQPVEK